MFKKLIFIILSGFVVIGSLGVLFVAAASAHVFTYSSEFIYKDIKELESAMQGKAGAVIVFGAYVYDNGNPSPMLEDRLTTGISVYENEMAAKILLSGDHGTRGYDEVNAMKKFVLGHGTDPADIFLDHAGFSTYDTVSRAVLIFGIEKAVLSTQEYHLSRAIYIARKSGIEAYGIAADIKNYPRGEMRRYLVREWLARAKDFVYVNILKPGPVISGDPIPIDGDGRLTHD
ncbi:MAG: YdcF family protein [Clostridia bacterium]|nr:YdcF family protein [Clostridia bacterium]